MIVSGHEWSLNAKRGVMWGLVRGLEVLVGEWWYRRSLIEVMLKRSGWLLQLRSGEFCAWNYNESDLAYFSGNEARHEESASFASMA